MNYFTIAAVLLYVGAASNSYMHHNYAFAGMWLSYSFANLCLVFAEIGKA